MHTSSAGPDTACLDVQHVTCRIPSATLGWRDLPTDAAVTVQYSFSTTSLLELDARYQGTDWSFTIHDPSYGIVTPSGEQAPRRGSATRRALKTALDQVGIRLVEHSESAGKAEGSNI